ncbi:MAG: membrane integrity-associated transporter subunit PqiC [Desulfovibrio sp.]|nr:membrane integrity-associated transporter subunit PqiC [Desulfovibrio sp.]
MHRYMSLTLFLSIFLTACGHSVPTRYYLLESSHTPLKCDNLPSKRLRLAEVTVPEYLDRNGIVSRVQGSTEVIVSQFHAWAEPVANGVRRLFQERLGKSLLAADVNTLAAGDDSPSNYTLYIEIQRLDADFHADAILEARWTLRGNRENVLGTGIYADKEAVTGKTYDELVAAESSVLCRMADHLSQCLTAALSKN